MIMAEDDWFVRVQPRANLDILKVIDVSAAVQVTHKRAEGYPLRG